MNGSRDPVEDEAIRREIEAAMEQFERLDSEEEKERRRRRATEEVWGVVTPEDRDRFQRNFMVEVFHMCDPETQAVLRQFATALPLPESQESLRKELTDARDRTARISSTLKQQTGKLPRIKHPRPPGRMLTVKQMAEALTLSSDVVYKMCEAGEIPGVKRMPTGSKKNKTWRADAVIFERWRISPDRRKR
jgi:excisionase family DNA binding protein